MKKRQTKLPRSEHESGIVRRLIAGGRRGKWRRVRLKAMIQRQLKRTIPTKLEQMEVWTETLVTLTAPLMRE